MNFMLAFRKLNICSADDVYQQRYLNYSSLVSAEVSNSTHNDCSCYCLSNEASAPLGITSKFVALFTSFKAEKRRVERKKKGRDKSVELAPVLF